MITKRLPFQASTLCAGGTLLVLGGFLALNLAGCGGGGGGGLVTATAIPGTTAAPVPATVQFLLQTSDGTAANGGNITLTNTTGRVYTANANAKGVAGVRGIIPGLYTLVFVVTTKNSSTGPTTSVSTTRSISISSASGVQTFSLRQGDTGNSNPFTISGRVLLNPAGPKDPDGNPATANCSAVLTPITDAIIITVQDLNSTNGTPIIAQVVRPAQPSTTIGTERGLYSISIPYRPRSFQVTVTNSSDAPFAGASASTSFPQTVTTVGNVDICTNNSNIAPQPSVTSTPIPTPYATPTTVGTPSATFTPTPVSNPTATTAPAATSTPIPTATTAPANTPIPGITGVPTPTLPTTTATTVPGTTPTTSAFSKRR